MMQIDIIEKNTLSNIKDFINILKQNKLGTFSNLGVLITSYVYMQLITFIQLQHNFKVEDIIKLETLKQEYNLKFSHTFIKL